MKKMERIKNQFVSYKVKVVIVGERDTARKLKNKST